MQPRNFFNIAFRKIFMVLLLTMGWHAADAIAAFGKPPAGASESEVRAAMGKPYAVHRASPEVGYAYSWEYPHGPSGRQTFMARFDLTHRLLRVDQVLTPATLALLRPGVDTQATVQDVLGRPGRNAGRSRVYGGPTWDYFAEDMGRHVILSVTFDGSGRLAAAGSTLDPDEEVLQR
ncbi:MAG: outer membrane protein assembly factor BamE [Betaproteobacteria bacterium]|nr:outer membrane protein assembly factor BamE [Betaproteobacteria bacterium]